MVREIECDECDGAGYEQIYTRDGNIEEKDCYACGGYGTLVVYTSDSIEGLEVEEEAILDLLEDFDIDNLGIF